MLPTDRVGSARYCWPTSTNGRSGIDPAMDRQLVGDDLVEAAAEVDRAGLAGRRRRPRHIALDGEVDLERAGPVTEPAVRAGDATRQPVAEDVGGDRRRHVEHQHVARREVGDRGDAHAGLDRAAVTVEVGRQARRRSPASRPRPRPIPWRAPATISISPTALVIGRSRREKACAATPAHSALACSVVHVHASVVAGSIAPAPKRASVSGWRGTRSTGCEASANRSSKCDGHRLEHPTPPLAVAPERLGGPIDRSVQHAGRTVVERMGTVDRRVAASVSPPDGQVQPGEERRPGGDRMDGGAMVVHQTRRRSSPSCAFHRRSCRSPRARSRRARRGPAAPRRRARSAHCRRRSPSSRCHRDASCASNGHTRPPLPGWATPGATYPGSVQVTVCGIGPLGSHGCSL